MVKDINLNTFTSDTARNLNTESLNTLNSLELMDRDRYFKEILGKIAIESSSNGLKNSINVFGKGMGYTMEEITYTIGQLTLRGFKVEGINMFNNPDMARVLDFHKELGWVVSW